MLTTKIGAKLNSELLHKLKGNTTPIPFIEHNWGMLLMVMLSSSLKKTTLIFLL